MDRDPSRGALLLALCALLLVGLSFSLPWWSFDSSTGRKTPDGGPQDPDDTRVERHSLDFLPFRLVGDQQPSDAEGADRAALGLGIAASVAAAGLGLFLIFEALRFRWSIPRPASLVVAAISLVALVGGLVYTCLAVPATMAGNGVTGVFTDRLVDPEYVRTALGLGWVLATLAVPLGLGAMAFRYQAGSHDPAAVEAYA
jgi:hypothetical protein